MHRREHADEDSDADTSAAASLQQQQQQQQQEQRSQVFRQREPTDVAISGGSSSDAAEHLVATEQQPPHHAHAHHHTHETTLLGFLHIAHVDAAAAGAATSAAHADADVVGMSSHTDAADGDKDNKECVFATVDVGDDNEPYDERAMLFAARDENNNNSNGMSTGAIAPVGDGYSSTTTTTAAAAAAAKQDGVDSVVELTQLRDDNGGGGGNDDGKQATPLLLPSSSSATHAGATPARDMDDDVDNTPRRRSSSSGGGGGDIKCVAAVRRVLRWYARRLCGADPSRSVYGVFPVLHELAVTFVFVLVTLVAFALLAHYAFHPLLNHTLPVFLPAFGASATVVFAAPKAAMSQPRVVLFAHMSGALLGVVAANVLQLDDTPHVLVRQCMAGALGVGVHLALMQGTNTLHPPASATVVSAALSPLNAYYHDRGFLFLVSPTLCGTLLVLVFAWLLNNLVASRAPYPQFW